MYIHGGKTPVTLKNDPADPDGSDWVFFCYGGYLDNGAIVKRWLRSDETITANTALISGGNVVTDSTYVGTLIEGGVEMYEVYGVQFEFLPESRIVVVTHRVSTATSGAVNLARLKMDRSVVILATGQ